MSTIPATITRCVPIHCSYCAWAADFTPLGRAIHEGNTTEVKRILAATPTEGVDNIFPAACLAVAGEHTKIMGLLREHWPGPILNSAFVHAARHGSLAAMAVLRSWPESMNVELSFDNAAAEAINSGTTNVFHAIALLVYWTLEDERQTFCDRILATVAFEVRPDIARFLIERYQASPARALDIVFDRVPRRNPTDDELNTENRTVDFLVRWQGRIRREEHHRDLLRMALTLAPLSLSTYALLWLLEWTVPPRRYAKESCLNELHRVRLLERVATEYERTVAGRDRP